MTDKLVVGRINFGNCINQEVSGDKINAVFNSLAGKRVLITRKEAREFAESQMNHETAASNPDGGSLWHYGKCEIEELLDKIYGFNSKGERA